ATAVAVGVFSHIVLDIIQHEPDIALLPVAFGPRLGLNLRGWPALNFLVELLYGAGCWWVFGGPIGLLVAIIIFNVANLPTMFPRPGTGEILGRHPAALPTIILAQVVLTWLAVWYFGRSHDVAGARIFRRA